ALGWLLSLLALGAALRWRDGSLAGRPRQGAWFALAAGAAALAVGGAPGNPLLLAPLLYIAWPRRAYQPRYHDPLLLDPHYGAVARSRGQRGLLGYALAALLPLLLWQALIQVGRVATPGAVGGESPLRDGVFWSLLIGQLVNNLLTVFGFLFLLVGLGLRA